MVFFVLFFKLMVLDEKALNLRSVLAAAVWMLCLELTWEPLMCNRVKWFRGGGWLGEQQVMGWSRKL